MNRTYYALRDANGSWYRRDRKWHGKPEHEWSAFTLDSLFQSKSLAEFVRDDCGALKEDVKLVTFILQVIEEPTSGTDQLRQ